MSSEELINEDFLFCDGTIYDYNGTARAVVIPAAIEGQPVTSIEALTFARKRLTSVTIPNSVTSIEVLAFIWNRLTSVTIPGSVTSIGEWAFCHNDRLTAIMVDPANQFYTSIEGILCSKDGKTLVFYPAGKKNNAIIPEGVTSIGIGAFADSRLASVTIPDGVTSIGESVFSGNHNLTAIMVDPANQFYTSIEGILCSKDGKTLVSYPAGKGNNAAIPEGVTSIGIGAFANSRLTSVTIPDGVASIGDFAFSDNCLTGVTIPNSVTSIGKSAFGGNYSLTAIMVDPANQFYTSIEGILCSKDGKTLVFYPAGKENNAVIPEGVTSIGFGAFNDSRLASVTIGANAAIDENAFEKGFAEFYDSNEKKAGVYTYARTWKYNGPVERQHHSRQGVFDFL